MMNIKKVMMMAISITWGININTTVWGVDQAEAQMGRETLNLLQKKLVEINSQTYNTHRDKNRVLVLGPTGSGKSTLVTYLAGISLQIGQKLSGQKTLIAQGQLPGIEIGDGALAQTKVPAAWVDTTNDVVYWDCPGFLDTEGPAQEISNAAMIHKIVYNETRRSSDPVKILFVVPHDYINDEEGTYFYNQLTRVTGMFPDEQLGRSLYLVITQVRLGLNIKPKILQLLDNMQRQGLILKEREVSIVRTMISSVNNDLFYVFPKPDMDSLIGSDYAADRDAIDQVLYAEHIPLRVALNLSPEAAEYIGGLCAACQKHLIGQFRKQGPQIIKDNFVQKMQREDYEQVKAQIQRLKTLEENIREMDPFTIAAKLEEFVGSSVREEIEKTLHTLAALKTLEGFRGVDVNSLMKNLLKTVFPEVIRTVSEQLVMNIGNYIAIQGEEGVRGLEAQRLLEWYQGLETTTEVNTALARFRGIADTEKTSQYATIVEYLQGMDNTVKFDNKNVITMIRNAHAPYVVSVLQRELQQAKNQQGRIEELEKEGKKQTNRVSEIQDQKRQLEEQIQQLMIEQEEEQQRIKELEAQISRMAEKPAEVTMMSAAAVVVESPVKGLAIPEIARGYEEIYQRFVNGKLIYRPNKNSDAGKIELRLAEIMNPGTLEGTFDLRGCGDTGKYLSISTGYKKGKIAANQGKVEIWFTPRFMVERAAPPQYRTIMDEWRNNSAATIGIFWTWGNDDNLESYDYLTTQTPENISDNNLYEKWSCAVRTGPPGVASTACITFPGRRRHIFLEFMPMPAEAAAAAFMFIL